jgi:hypothetical protein
VQTFLPYRDFARSAAVLDRARLGKQRVETLQVLRALELPDYGWRHHPAVTMWRGRTPALVAYGLACVDAWTAQGRADSTAAQIAEFAPEVVGRSQADLAAAGLLPGWLGDGALHLSHRSALVRKDPSFYRQVFGDVPDDLPYVWPDPDPDPDGAAAPPPTGVPVWVVRTDGDDPARDGGSPLDGAVRLAAPPQRGARSPKWRRQVQAFTHEAQVGDAVAVPVDGGAWLAVGVLTGEPVAEGEVLRRDVEWRGRAPRASVLRPALLQDPRKVFRVDLDPVTAAAAAPPG